MRWARLTLELADINLHKQLNSDFSEIFNQNNHPEGMFLYQADPNYFVDYYISYKKTDSWMVTGFKKKYFTLDVSEPDTSKLFLLIGEKKRSIPLVKL